MTALSHLTDIKKNPTALSHLTDILDTKNEK